MEATMEMVEKVAQAIKATGLVGDEAAFEVARVAVQAMACFPSTVMIEAGKDALTNPAEATDDEMRLVWLEMVNAALSERQDRQQAGRLSL